MSLSRFYKQNQDFQPDNILPQSSALSNQPIWGESIIKEDIQEPDPPEIPAEVETVKEIIPETTVEEITEEPQPPPPDPLPSEPEVDIEAIRSEAFSSGVDLGRKEAEEDFENGVNTFLCICNELDKLRETILKNSLTEMKELVMDISEKIIRHSITEQNDTIVATIKEAIQLAVKSEEIQIQINPDDLQCIEEKKQEIIDSISGLTNIALQSDATIERGGCKLESSCCTVDATLSNQIKVIKDNVMATDVVSDENRD